MKPRLFATRLLAWYDANKRVLPWRDVKDPWATWVSEVMLQQTRVEVVRAAFVRFMARYPTPTAWAAASDDDVLSSWQGLGYYRRARLLRDGARTVVETHGGRVPGDLDALGRLPGVGSYTRGAIASIAFAQPVPAIDGNVERVLARHRGIEANVKTAGGARAVRAAVTALLSVERPGDFNQALMDLGATVCTPRAPRCAACPLAADCVARRAGRQAELPVLPRAKATVDVVARVVFVRLSDGRVLGQRVAAGAINAGQVDLVGAGPLVHVADADDLVASVTERFCSGVLRVDLRVDREPLCRVRHTITCHRITMWAHRGELSRPHVSAPFVLAPFDGETPWTTLARKVVHKIDSAPEASVFSRRDPRQTLKRR